jgi:hypothetical protein
MFSRPVYLETSALVKLVALEAESEVLRKFLSKHSVVVTSAIARVELPRALHAVEAPNALYARAERVLDRVTQIVLDTAVLQGAAELEPWNLTPAQSLHLASAQLLGDELACFITYDEALVHAAGKLSMEVASPA